MDPLEPAEIQISPEKVCFVVIKAREFDVKDLVTEPDPASNPTDDKMIAVLENRKDDLVIQELTSFIAVMSEDEQIDRPWLGRGDCTERLPRRRARAARLFLRAIRNQSALTLGRPAKGGWL